MLVVSIRFILTCCTWNHIVGPIKSFLEEIIIPLFSIEILQFNFKVNPTPLSAPPPKLQLIIICLLVSVYHSSLNLNKSTNSYPFGSGVCDEERKTIYKTINNVFPCAFVQRSSYAELELELFSIGTNKRVSPTHTHTSEYTVIQFLDSAMANNDALTPHSYE